MMHAASPWTQQMDAVIRTYNSQEARSFTRRREGGKTVGLRPWGLPFETVGGDAWYDTLEWTQAGWR
eukprot:6099148-Pyramimonas_sp.AAC.1